MADHQRAGGSIPVAQALREAAERAGRAPSILNTQPWHWVVRDDALELYADRTRQVVSIDPDGRLLTLSCGAALHYARLALAAAGYEPAVARQPDPDSPLLLARLRVAGPHPVGSDDVNNIRSMGRRRSDRRPFAATAPVPEDAIQTLQAAAENEGAWLYRVGPDQIVFLRAAAERAQQSETKGEGYLDELRAWTSDRPSDEGVAADVFVAPVPRPIPLRDLAAGRAALLDPGTGDDRFAEYLVLATDRDEAIDWLRAGEATSSTWLAATELGLAVSAISEVVEVAGARVLLRSLLGRPGHPQLVLRAGLDVQPVPPPASPRRRPEEVIDEERS